MPSELLQRKHEDGTQELSDCWMLAIRHSKQNHIFWFGFSTNVPEEIIDTVHRKLGAFMQCRRSKRRADEHGFSPMAWMGDEGIELLTPSSRVCQSSRPSCEASRLGAIPKA